MFNAIVEKGKREGLSEVSLQSALGLPDGGTSVRVGGVVGGMMSRLAGEREFFL